MPVRYACDGDVMSSALCGRRVEMVRPPRTGSATPGRRTGSADAVEPYAESARVARYLRRLARSSEARAARRVFSSMSITTRIDSAAAQSKIAMTTAATMLAMK